MELIHGKQIKALSNSGATSLQLLFPENSRSTRLGEQPRQREHVLPMNV